MSLRTFVIIPPDLEKKARDHILTELERLAPHLTALRMRPIRLSQMDIDRLVCFRKATQRHVDLVNLHRLSLLANQPLDLIPIFGEGAVEAVANLNLHGAYAPQTVLEGMGWECVLGLEPFLQAHAH